MVIILNVQGIKSGLTVLHGQPEVCIPRIENPQNNNIGTFSICVPLHPNMLLSRFAIISTRHLQPLRLQMTHPRGHDLSFWHQTVKMFLFVLVFQMSVSCHTVLYFRWSVFCSSTQELQQKEEQWRTRCEELQVQVQQLQEDREELQSRLKGSNAQEGTSSETHSHTPNLGLKGSVLSLFKKPRPHSSRRCLGFSHDFLIPEMWGLELYTNRELNFLLRV